MAGLRRNTRPESIGIRTALTKSNMRILKAHVPMSEMLEFEPTLTSITGGRGSFLMEFSHYEEVPGQLQQKRPVLVPHVEAQVILDSFSPGSDIPINSRSFPLRLDSVFTLGILFLTMEKGITARGGLLCHRAQKGKFYPQSLARGITIFRINCLKGTHMALSAKLP